MHRRATSTVYLASQSPRRQEILMQIGVPFQLLSVSVDEVRRAYELPEAYVQRLAEEKAQAGVKALAFESLIEAPVLGADTIVLCQGQVLEKPENENDALAMLTLLSAREHEVLTAVCLATTEKSCIRLSTTKVCFREITEEEIRRYWQTGEPQDKAGAYAIQGLGSVFVRSINGSYSAVVGLPIEQTVELLREFDLPWWQAEDKL